MGVGHLVGVVLLLLVIALVKYVFLRRPPQQAATHGVDGRQAFNDRSHGMHAQEMIATHPHVAGRADAMLVRCIEECVACAQACTACADACLGEASVGELTQCIRLNLDCADICVATGAVATRQTGSNQDTLRAMIATCSVACRMCGEECARHAGHHRHCQICAVACTRCEEACRAALTATH